MKTLLLNAGSSSLKFAVMEAMSESKLASGAAAWPNGNFTCRVQVDGRETDVEMAQGDHETALRHILDELRTRRIDFFEGADPIAVVGHRIVHGGHFTQTVPITPEVIAGIKKCIPLAPLHDPVGLQMIELARIELSAAEHFACFDTTFHTTIPDSISQYAIPRRWANDFKIRRYGFHGLSHQYVSDRATEMLADHSRVLNGNGLRMVSCHLGHGCSAAAIVNGVCVDTTMGFTPLDGLVMATRCGQLDPSVVLHLQTEYQIEIEELSRALNKRSGLLGVSELSADMRVLEQAVAEGHEPSQLAIDMYCLRIGKAIAGLAATMEGLDALVFTAGVGENSSMVRERVCRGLGFLGINIDPGLNQQCQPDQEISTQDASIATLVIRSCEDVTMVREIVKRKESACQVT